MKLESNGDEMNPSECKGIDSIYVQNNHDNMHQTWSECTIISGENAVTENFWTENFWTNEVISHDTLEASSHYRLPETFFEVELSELCHFEVTKGDWQKLVMESRVNARVFQTREWCNFFTRIIEEHNPYCTIMFIRHYVSAKCTQPEQIDGILFRAYGYCCFRRKQSTALDR